MEVRNINELNGKINGLEEIVAMVGTRKEIYGMIGEKNPLAIIDYRQAQVNIDDTDFIVVLKKTGNGYAVRIFWDIKNQIQYAR